jgi:RNA polymerase sigma-70 factor, ECF subfamily
MVAPENASGTESLLQRVRDNDPQALAELCARHGERLRLMVRLRLDRRLRGRVASAAVLREVFRDASQQVAEFLAEPSRPFFLWLRAVAGRRLQVLHREYLGEQAGEASREIALGRGPGPSVDAGALAAQLLGHPGAGPDARRAELQAQLQDALNGMDPLDREVLALSHFEELSNAEAAAVLGLEPAAASQHYVRALKRLKEILQGIPGFFDRSS